MDTAALPPAEQFRELDEEGLTALLAKVLGKSWNADRSQKLIDEEIDGRVFLSYQTPEKWRATFGFAQGTCSKLAEIVEFVTNASQGAAAAAASSVTSLSSMSSSNSPLPATEFQLGLATNMNLESFNTAAVKAHVQGHVSAELEQYIESENLTGTDFNDALVIESLLDKFPKHQVSKLFRRLKTLSKFVFVPGALFLNRYEVQRELQSGAFASVFSAIDRNFSVKHGQKLPLVALKVQHFKNDTEKTRFLREANLLRRLEGVNFVKIHSKEIFDDWGVLVEEFLQDGTLDDYLRAHSVTEIEILRFGLDLTDGLKVLEREGILHRDLKPANVMLRIDEFGQVRLVLVDFGLAKQMLDTAVTETVGAMGTVLFMSPEQTTSAKTVDCRADVWAVIVMLYLMATKRYPFANMGEIQTQHFIPKFVTELSPAFGDMVAKGLDKNILCRYQNAHELQLALLAVLRHHGLASFLAFTSYRVRSDGEFAERLYDALSSKQLGNGDRFRTYLDKKELQPGERWEDGFKKGLSQSTVFVPLISTGVLAPMANLSDEVVDNVLVEMEIAIELSLSPTSPLTAILPIAIGDLKDGFRDSSSVWKAKAALPAKVHPASKRVAHSFLAALGLEPTAAFATRTVADVIKFLFDFQGCVDLQRKETEEQGISRAASLVLATVEKQLGNNAEEASQSRTTASQPPTPVRVPSPAPSANPDATPKATPKATEKALSQVDVDRLGKELFDAAYNGETDSVRAVLTTIQHRPNKGSVVGWRGRSGWTPLHYAANEGHCEVATVLLREGGADASAKNKDGRTPLHLAANKGHCEVATVLLREGGADASAKDDWGDTPLHWAGYFGYSAVVEALLREEGCDASVKNNKGETALDRARNNNIGAVVALLAGR